jgi:hypothetical protein
MLRARVRQLLKSLGDQRRHPLAELDIVRRRYRASVWYEPQ